jgi:hypothetical protein
MKEKKVKRCVEGIISDVEAVEHVFEILRNQNEY